MFSEVRAYHLELLQKVRPLEDFFLVEFDEPLFSNFRIYYENISKKLGIPCDRLTSNSRHSFFIACQQEKGLWLSGLELLMGYEFPSDKEVQSSPLITSGNYEIDLLAEIILCLPPELIPSLLQNKSQTYLSKLIHQVSRRSQGQEAIDKVQRERDLKFLESFDDEAKKGLWTNL